MAIKIVTVTLNNVPVYFIEQNSTIVEGPFHIFWEAEAAVQELEVYTNE